MLLRLTNSLKVRIVGDITWSALTGLVHDVQDPELALQLLTSPGEQFVVADDTDPEKLLEETWPTVTSPTDSKRSG